MQVMTVHPAEMDEPIEMSFGGDLWPKESCITTAPPGKYD